ncbi:histidinol-phosphate aminotransferase [Tamilnaduibacter salinus]|uniref:Histidinol-phosphate aminotransferase n=1 Tax=Tamilnaduibacter salinus TaxID=1484056 RepID=A0A2U1D040_9GAMM|nr:histidinol-phosphate transaminase [Tamilnaduibacter salinus]PVY78408.1 histidinol-phosphate aminotransferase [Tamilnaduibacter salinus]
MPVDFQQRAVEGVRGLQPYQPGKPIDEVAREHGLDPASIIKLASNENPLGPSPKAMAAAREALSELARYPDGNAFQLKNALSARFGINTDQITLGNGSNDVLELAARTFAGPGAEVVFSEYAFAVYPIATRAVGASGVAVPARDWGHDLDAMAAAITERTRVIFVANPNNPTGTAVDRDTLVAFLERVPGHIPVVLDEAYCEYMTDPAYPDGLAMLSDYPNLIVARTFSKAWGLAGLRVGYALSSPEIADLMNRVRQPFNVDNVAQAAATAVLEDKDYLAESRRVNEAGRDQLMAGFERLGLTAIPSHGNFVTVDTGRDANAVFEAMLGDGVIVRPLGGYGMPRHLRVSVGLTDENDRCIAALGRALGAAP